MDLQSIATESQTLRSTIRDLRSVIATDKERLERHEGELAAALERVAVLEREAQEAFALIRHSGERGSSSDLVPAEPPMPFGSLGGGAAAALDGGQIYNASPFGEPSQVAAE